MPPSLQEARRREEARLTALVAEIALEQGYDVNDRPHRGTVSGDRAAMRGVPLLSRGGVGSAMRGTSPGSDEHLATLD